jgi:hypothetical protein
MTPSGSIVNYYCMACVAAEMGITSHEALGWIRATRLDLQKKMETTALWQVAQANPPKDFEFVESSKKKKRLIIRQRVIDIFRPTAKAFILKQNKTKERAEHRALRKQLCEEMQKETNLDKIDVLLQKIDEAEDKFVAANEPLAYADRATSRVELFRYQIAADYSDSWVEVKNSAGTLIGGFSACYICRAGAQDSKCNTLILSKEWAGRHHDILASEQKWKCKCCGAKYMTKFGMVVEIRLVSGGFHLCLADCCDADDKDLHALILQEKFEQAQTPEELYDLIPTVLPQETAFLKKAVRSDFWNGEATDFGVYKLMNFNILLSLPKWNWKNIGQFLQ